MSCACHLVDIKASRGSFFKSAGTQNPIKALLSIMTSTENSL